MKFEQWVADYVPVGFTVDSLMTRLRENCDDYQFSRLEDYMEEEENSVRMKVLRSTFEMIKEGEKNAVLYDIKFQQGDRVRVVRSDGSVTSHTISITPCDNQVYFEKGMKEYNKNRLFAFAVDYRRKSF